MRPPLILLLLLTLTLSPQRATADERPATCTYTTYRWSVPLKRAVDRHTVRHPYADLRPEEVDWYATKADISLSRPVQGFD